MNAKQTQTRPEAWLRAAKNWAKENLTWPAIICLCMALVWITPFLWMVAAALRPDSGGADIASILPKLPLSLTYFRDALDSADWGLLYVNTILFTLGTLGVQLITITTAGYAFAFGEFRGKETIFHLFLVQLMLVPVVLMVPNMMTLKSLGLLDTLPGVMAPYFASAFGTFLVRQAFRGIPREMEEAAVAEGASVFQILIHVMIPAIRPSLIAFSIISITAHWNEYLWPLMALNNPDSQVLTIGLVSFAMGAEAGAEWGLIAAGTLMVCLPLMIAFIAFQKQFISSFGFTEYK